MERLAPLTDLEAFATMNRDLKWCLSFYELVEGQRPILEFRSADVLVRSLRGASRGVSVWPLRRARRPRARSQSPGGASIRSAGDVGAGDVDMLPEGPPQPLEDGSAEEDGGSSSSECDEAWLGSDGEPMEKGSDNSSDEEDGDDMPDDDPEEGTATGEQESEAEQQMDEESEDPLDEAGPGNDNHAGDLFRDFLAEAPQAAAAAAVEPPSPPPAPAPAARVALGRHGRSCCRTALSSITTRVSQISRPRASCMGRRPHAGSPERVSPLPSGIGQARGGRSA